MLSLILSIVRIKVRKYPLFLISIFFIAFNSPTFALSSGDSINFSESFVQFNAISDLSAGFDKIASSLNRFVSSKVSIANKVLLGSGDDELKIVRVGFSSVVSDSIENSQMFDQLSQNDASVAPQVIGKALVFPNPFRQGTDSGAELGYRLSKDMDIEIHVYNMLAQKILHRSFFSGAVGARQGYNKLNINREMLEGSLLSAGIYFYLIIHNDTVLAKGKMAVKP